MFVQSVGWRPGLFCRLGAGPVAYLAAVIESAQPLQPTNRLPELGLTQDS